MASVTKIVRQRPNGSVLTRFRLTWMIDAVRANGKPYRKRQTKKFKTKSEADAERVRIETQLARGIAPDSPTVHTFGEAALAFLDYFENVLVRTGRRERSTLDAYKRHVNLHLARTKLWGVKLSRLTTPICQAALTEIETTESADMAVRCRARVVQILDHAQRQGWIVGNPADPTKLAEDGERTSDPEVEIPSKTDMQKMLAAAKRFDNTGRAEAAFRSLAFAGLRISEMIGLSRPQLMELRDPNARVKVTQRADRYGKIGSPKSKSGWREVPIGPATAAAILFWLKECPASKEHLVFPTSTGTVDSYHNWRTRVFIPVLRSVGLTYLRPIDDPVTGYIKVVAGAEGSPAIALAEVPRYTPHQFRHFYASMQIENGVKPKRLQKQMGHTSIQMTMDLYGHLWTDRLGDAAMAEAAERLVDTAKAETDDS